MRSTLVFIATLALAFAAPIPFTIRKTPDGRIIGGEDTDITAYPHQISLEWTGLHICGGSIIADRWVITAAHCTDGSVATDFQIRAGTTTVESGGTLVDVLNIHQNPNYIPPLIDFDISILHLADALVFSDSIQAIGLPSAQPADGIEVAVTGWGPTSEGGSPSTILQVVFVNIVSMAECSTAYSGETITENMLCAGVPEGGKGTCQSDSGGPLIADSILYGIVTWGFGGCARPGFPGIYANVASLCDYITEITGL